jgi:HSP20 family protein
MFRWRVGRDPYWDEFHRIQKSLDDLFNVLSGGPRAAAGAPLWSGARLFPLLNVAQYEDRYVVTAEIPGMKTEDLQINIEGDTLSLRGERKPYELAGDASYHRRERAVGAFQRSITLPGNIDPDTVKATYKDGVLTVALQKEKAVKPKQIQISAE